MTVWKSYGASVRGPGHIATGAPNQDAWASFHCVWGDGIVVSDGVGSKPLSNLGSAAACLAGKYAARAWRQGAKFHRDALFNDIRSHWLACIAPLEARDCAATCLFAFWLGDDVLHLGMLGDGLVAAVKADGSVISLSEDKSQGFSNMTAALAPTTSAKDWRYVSLPARECTAVLLCTDGVADDLDDVDGFVKGFVEAHCPRAALSANRHARAMLENWPTPRHSDDKTIACLYRDEALDA
jgi:serine/threonine protein phosphatase PrpC